MKKLFALAVLALFLTAGVAMAQDCVTIQDGTLTNTAGDTLETGYDVWGYNYQGHIFNGGYCDAYRDAGWCQAYRDVELIMKWNDAWLSNADCTEDGLLDRHLSYPSYIGSGAWTTNHQSGTYYPYPDKPNKGCRWTYFVKIVAAPADATLTGGVWWDGSGDEIGPQIWGEFATIQSVYNDPCDGQTGIEYKGARPGLGNWDVP